MGTRVRADGTREPCWAGCSSPRGFAPPSSTSILGSKPAALSSLRQVHLPLLFLNAHAHSGREVAFLWFPPWHEGSLSPGAEEVAWQRGKEALESGRSGSMSLLLH